MRAVWITKHGGPDVLEVRTTPDPVPGPGEVRVRVRAAGLNFAEVTARQGLYPDAPKPPCVVGYEGAGVIDQLGPGVSGLEVGARVLYLSRFWGHSDVVCVKAAQAIPMPDSMSFEDGAALPVNYLTAYHMLFEIHRLRPGTKLLVHMAAGGVGTAVLQLARTVPDVTVFGTASASKHGYLREQGCTHPIDYRTLDYVKEVERIAGPRSLDLVLDPLGGADWKKGYGLLRSTGTLIAFGFANVSTGGTRKLLHLAKQFARVPRWSPLALMDDNRGVAGVNMGHLWDETELLRRESFELLRLYGAGSIRPVVTAKYPFSRAKDAFLELEEGRNIGKVLLMPD
jgi:synaptic vesicle membrane protein VAT-1